jgi:non-heme chloroperoxidase
MTSGAESERLFEAYSIPSPARPLFQTAFGNLNRRSPTAMDTQNPDRGPLLLISCQKATWSQTSRSCGGF